MDFVKILDSRDTTTCVLASDRATCTQAVYVIQKRAANEEEARGVVERGVACDATLVQRNDKYAQYSVTVPDQITVNTIFPATPKDIAKYSHVNSFVLRETPALYHSVTLPYVDSLPAEELSWVTHLIDGTSEQDRVLCQSPTMVLVKDTKWHTSDASSMYLLAIIKFPPGRNLRSIRDLRGDDVPMLLDVKEATLKIALERFGVKPRDILVFFHYFPSFWHLHLHFVCVNSGSSFGRNNSAGKAILLDDVTDNLLSDPSYYANAKITVIIDSPQLGALFGNL
ncbi:scavenger mRNA decapping enzyme [Pelomyxa schiedti]|nr:scavenger mRNA decapping enzyme [Pelomyxa schiedti]